MTTKPSRSDEVLEADQQLEITNKIRAHFESMLPKRPSKPNRSESDSSTVPPPPTSYSVPEMDKLKSLQSQSQAILIEAGAVEQEEFVETEYYKELDSVDKLHHTTGSGFIKVASEIPEIFCDFRYGGSHENGNGRLRVMEARSNPATNDWIPSIEDDHQVC